MENRELRDNGREIGYFKHSAFREYSDLDLKKYADLDIVVKAIRIQQQQSELVRIGTNYKGGIWHQWVPSHWLLMILNALFL